MQKIAFLILVFLGILLPCRESSAAQEWLTFNYFLDAELEPIEPVPVDKFAIALSEAEAKNDAEMLYKFGRIYGESIGVKEDKVKAEKYLEKAAESGLEKAQLALGIFYNFKGDITKARKWFNKAAEKGNTKAMFQLGFFNELGRGSFQNNEKAIEYYNTSSDGGYIKASLRLALHYQNMSPKPDFDKAIAFYKKAETQANEETKLKISLLLAKLYADIAEGKGDLSDVFTWRFKAAELGDLDSQVKIAQSYLNGLGVETNYEEALKWFNKAANLGNTESMTMLGYLYSNGLGVDINFEEAIRWYTYASERGNEEAAWSLGNMYLTGNGVKQNTKEAEKWFARAKVLKEKNALITNKK